MKKPNVTLLLGYVPFVFVVPPVDFTVTKITNHESVQIVDKGEITINGNRQLQKISFSGFFPNTKSNLYSLLNPLPPKVCEETLNYNLLENTICKLIVPEWLHFFKCKIESFTINHQDHTGDIYYSITLIEEREDISTMLDAVLSVF
ncbi:MAG: peptidoglycan-binding protein [Fusobacteriaceae bacterium]